MTRIISFVNEKGGTGKTTLTLNVGAYLAAKGKKTLLVDLDPQGHIGKSLGIRVKNLPVTIFDVLLDDDLTLRDAMLATRVPNLFVVPANKLLTDFVVNVADEPDRHLKLKNSIRGLDDFEFILLDSPPSLGLSTVNILLATKEVVIPVSLTFLALDGCAEILDTIRTVKRNFAKDDLKVTAIVPTFYRETNLVKSILAKLNERFGRVVTSEILRYDARIDQAQSYGQTIFDFAPDSEGARMLGTIAEDILNRE